MMSLGFRKNDYRNLTSDFIEDDDLDQTEGNRPAFSDVLNTQDALWEIWDLLKGQADVLSVPIFDEGSFPDFLNFITEGNPYFE